MLSVASAQEAVASFPLAAWCDEAGFEGAGRERHGTCPKCGKPRKLVVNIVRRRWHCWVCQRKEVRDVRDRSGLVLRRSVTVEGGGGVVALLAWYYQVDRKTAFSWVLGFTRQVPIYAAQLPEFDTISEVLDDPCDLEPPDPPENAVQLSPDNLLYLASRGIDARMASAYGLFACDRGRYAHRIVFPAWERDGSLRYWQARATWPASADEARGRRHIKVLNPPRDEADPRVTSEHAVFNLHRAVALGAGRVVLCEGPISAMRAGDDAVALWGKALYDGQLRELIAAGVREVDVMFDGPTEREPHGAIAEALEIARRIRLFFRTRIVVLPAGDPGDYTREHNAAFRAHAIPFERVNGDALLRI